MKTLTVEQRHQLDRLYRIRAKVDADIAVITGTPDRPRTRTRRKTAECGTDSGYHHHIRYAKEPACDPCRRAHADAERDRVNRRTTNQTR